MSLAVVNSQTISQRIEESAHFQRVQEAARVSSTLVLCDVDLTLIRPKSVLGGAPLFDWMCDKTVSTFSLSQDEAVARISALARCIDEASTSVTVEEQTPTILQQMQAAGIPVLGCTARRPQSSAQTLKHLAGVNITLGQNLRVEEGMILNHGDSGNRAQFINGIIFAGTKDDKGSVLERLIEKTRLSFEEVVLADDTEENHFHMAAACERMGLSFHGVRYSAADHLKAKLDDKVAVAALCSFFQAHPEFKIEYSYLLR